MCVWRVGGTATAAAQGYSLCTSNDFVKDLFDTVRSRSLVNFYQAIRRYCTFVHEEEFQNIMGSCSIYSVNTICFYVLYVQEVFAWFFNKMVKRYHVRA